MARLEIRLNDLQSQCPQIAAEWDADLNGALTPTSVSIGSGKKVWWRCHRGHSWNAAVDSRVGRRSGCPVCAGQALLVGFNDLATTHPELAKEWIEFRNGDVRANDVFAGTGKKYWWRCLKGHEWRATGNSRLRPTGCPYCAGKQPIAGETDLATLQPELAAQLHPSKNEKLNSVELLPNSNRKVWWLCSKSHEWLASPNTRQNHGCPVCAGKKAWPGENDLGTTHPEIAAEWNTERNLPATVSTVQIGSHKKYWWTCDLGHDWLARCGSRIVSGCPVCAGRQVLPGYNDLPSLFPELVDEWDSVRNIGVNLNSISRGTNQKYWWTCENDHSWSASPANRTRGRGCPKCASHGFNPGKPAVFYFINHSSLNARKVGITNTDHIRLSKFQKNGWEIVEKFSSEDGEKIRMLEQMLLDWIRESEKLSVFLGAAEMGGSGGWTETFSTDGPTNKQVLAKIFDFRSALDL